MQEIFKQIEDAIYHDDMERFKELVNSLESINAQDKYGWSALHLAIRRGRIKMVEWLLESGANINIQDNSGWTPLMEAVMDDFAEIAKLLVDRGADLSIQNKRGATAAMLAQKFGRVSMYEFLN